MLKIRNTTYTVICCMVLMVVYASSCKKFADRIYRIKIDNHSSKTVNFLVADLLALSSIYPDTSLQATRPALQAVPPSKRRWNDSWTPWEEEYKQFPADTMSIFFIDNQVYLQTDWEDIRSDYMILQRYDLSIHDLQRLNFVVTYPPTPAMRHIKMFPPYEK